MITHGETHVVDSVLLEAHRSKWLSVVDVVFLLVSQNEGNMACPAVYAVCWVCGLI